MLTKVEGPTRSGRFAVLARKAEYEPWVQVESCYPAVAAVEYAQGLEDDDRTRTEVIAEYLTEDWGDDAP